jgi:hypothetical protein
VSVVGVIPRCRSYMCRARVAVSVLLRASSSLRADGAGHVCVTRVEFAMYVVAAATAFVVCVPGWCERAGGGDAGSGALAWVGRSARAGEWIVHGGARQGARERCSESRSNGSGGGGSVPQLTGIHVVRGRWRAVRMRRCATEAARSFEEMITRQMQSLFAAKGGGVAGEDDEDALGRDVAAGEGAGDDDGTADSSSSSSSSSSRSSTGSSSGSNNKNGNGSTSSGRRRIPGNPYRQV